MFNWDTHTVTSILFLAMKNLAVSTLLALSGSNAQKTNSEIMVDQPAINDGIIFNQGGETHQVSYLDREFSEDDGKLYLLF